MRQEYTFCVKGTHYFVHVQGDTREEALHDAVHLLNGIYSLKVDENNLVELPHFPPLGHGETVDTGK